MRYRDNRAADEDPKVEPARAVASPWRDLALCLSLFSIFFVLAVGAAIKRGAAIPAAWWIGLTLGHALLGWSAWRGFVRRDARAELRGFFARRWYISPPAWITAAHVVAKLPYLDAVPRWSTGIYYYALAKAIFTLDFGANGLAATYRLANHPSHAYSMYLAIGQILAPLSYVTANVQDLILAAFSIVCVWLLVCKIFPESPRAHHVLITLCFAFNPLVFAHGIGPNTDLPITVALVAALAAHIYDRPVLFAFAGLWMCFSKESGALMFGELVGLLWALEWVQRWREIDRTIVLRKIVAPLVPLVTFVFYFRSTPPLDWVERTSLWNDKADPVSSPAFGLSSFQFETGLVSALLHDFNWIATAAFVALLAKRQLWPKLPRRLDDDGRANLIRAMAWLFSLGVAFACLYIKDNHPRYYAPLIPLMLVLFLYALDELLRSSRVKTAILAVYCALCTAQVWSSLDPVGNAIWGTFSIGDRRVMFVQRGLQGQADGMIFNAQHDAVSRLYVKLNHAVFAGGQRPALIFGIDHPWVINYAHWGLRLDAQTLDYKYEPQGSFVPDVRTIGQITEETAPPYAVYVALPWLENPTQTLSKLRKIYRMTNEMEIRDGGYFVTAYELQR